MKEEVYQFNTGNEIVTLPLRADMKKIYIEVTTVCNYACITCIRHSWGDRLEHMPRATFDKILQDCRELPNLHTIHFGGFGEPLMHPDIIPMIKACKEQGYKTEMISNGSFLTADMAETLIHAGLDWLYISLDGSDADSFSAIRPGASFDEVVHNIRELQRLKAARGAENPAIGIEFVATKQNFQALPLMRKVVDELKARRFLVTNMLPYHESMKDEILYDGKELELESFGAEAVHLSVKTFIDMKFRTHRSCRFVETKAAAITCTGDVSPCYAFMHNYECYVFGRKKTMTAHSFGNVNEQTLKNIWSNPQYALFRWTVRNFQYPSCTDCRQVDGCDLAQGNESDCWGNRPSCGDCLWSRELILCP